MKLSHIRLLVCIGFMLVITLGFVLSINVGTLSAFGWNDIALICPLGALSTMLAAKTLIPRALISLLLAVVVILILGKAFCSWICPVPLISKLRGLTKSKSVRKREAEMRKYSEVADVEKGEKRGLEGGSRYVVLGSALLSAAVFGFPVFCLICPIGLAFATIMMGVLLFAGGDVTWGIILAPALLAVEVIFFRKWCHSLCPLSALMGLISRFNRTFHPSIDYSKCIETTKGADCGSCTRACAEEINLRDVSKGASLHECTKCHACAEACPTNAIKMRLLGKKQSED